jgi:prepilin-type N-terminal cleavage/methylation domain-containing protein
VEGQDGLTLLEAVAVLALLAVLAVLAVPNLFPAGVAVQSAARELAADMGLARQLAVSRSVPYVVEFQPGGGPFTRYTVRPLSGTDEPGFPKALPEGVSASGPVVVRFLPSGRADLPSSWAEWQLVAGSESATVRVWAVTGYARASR